LSVSISARSTRNYYSRSSQLKTSVYIDRLMCVQDVPIFEYNGLISDLSSWMYAPTRRRHTRPSMPRWKMNDR
jgi:hypothetical protein